MLCYDVLKGYNLGTMYVSSLQVYKNCRKMVFVIVQIRSGAKVLNSCSVPDGSSNIPFVIPHNMLHFFFPQSHLVI